MKRTLRLALIAAGILHAGEIKKITLDLSKTPEGDPPTEIFVVDGTMKVAAHEGKKILAISGDKPEVEAGAVIGESANGAASIQARIFASKVGRTLPKFGIGIHGQTGFRLVIFPGKKELQLVKNDEVIAAAAFEWKSGSWVQLRLEAKITPDGQWHISGTASPDGAAAPAAPQITHDPATLNAHGQCSLWGMPRSGTPILYDAVRYEVEN